MKLWQKETNINEAVETFTVGNDRDFDLQLAPFDIIGSIAHTKMLGSVGLLSAKETVDLTAALIDIYKTIPGAPFTETVAPAGTFSIAGDTEDIHSHIEMLLTEKLGETGKRIHSARSRNDQVLTDIKLFLRHNIELLCNDINAFFQLLQVKSETFRNHLLPGYTHMQLAMPSSFGLWFGAYAESLVDDLTTLRGAYDVVNKNPLGSAAGYGSSFPINRTLTTLLMGFDGLNYNVVYAQMSRGKTERITAQALANIADTLARLSMDVCLYLNQNFAFISFPAELTTGSSIMPHKKNPDVFELIRAKCNRIKALPNEIMMMTTNLPSGYQRDLQLLKENLFPAFTTLHDCLKMATLMLDNIEIKEHLLDDEKYKYAFSVEEVNKLVLGGTPFREAYKQVGSDIAENRFNYSTNINHSHEGSVGNLMNEEIAKLMDKVIAGFQFDKANAAMKNILN